MSPKFGFNARFERISPPGGLFLLVLSIFIGAITGLASVLFVKLIFAIQGFSYGGIHDHFAFLGNWVYFIVPIAGGLLVGPLILFASEAKGHGVPEVMTALIMRGGRIRGRVAAAKILASSLCIGTGGSAGREGPIIQVGSAFGSSIGQLLKLSDERIRNLVACGAAAGVAATFNAPIAGVIFSVEVLMSGLELRNFGNVVISAVTASVVSRSIIGSQSAFDVPEYAMNSMPEIFLYLILGLVAALVGVMFIKMLDFSENIFDNWKFPQIFKPAIGSVLLGVLGFLYMGLPGLQFPHPGPHTGYLSIPLPQMYGAGFAGIEQAISGGTLLWILCAMVILKPLATSMTLGSGNSGGVFAPSLFTGAMLGGVLGHLFNNWFPEMNLQVGPFALVGMAALFSATAHAPLTAMLIVFEMSGDYGLILPLMVAGVSASYFSQWLHQESIYTIKLAKRGIRFYEGRDMDIMQGVKVSEVMRTHPVTISKDASFSELMALFQETSLRGFPVMADESRLWGIITLGDVRIAQDQEDFNPRGLTVANLAKRDLMVMFPDEPIWLAIQKMSPRDLARLLVVERGSDDRLCGVISRSDILRAYDVGVVRKQRGELTESQATLRKQKEAGYMEFVLKEDDNCSMAKIKNLTIPDTVNLVSIRRGEQLVIPRSETQLQAGDVITVYGRLSDIDEVKNVMNACMIPNTVEPK